MMSIKEANKELKWVREVIREEGDLSWNKGYRDALLGVLGEDVEE